jgi:hypothetical protein
MILPRRIAVTCAAIALGALGTVGVAHAEGYAQDTPDRPSDASGEDQSDGYYTEDTDPEDTDSDDDSDNGDGCIPENDHSSADLYRYPECPGHRDYRDDEYHAEPEQGDGFSNFLGGH